MISAQPPQPIAPSRSPASQKPKIPAHTGSIANASAVRVALVRRCAHVWTRKASALAKMPVTSSALQTVQPARHLDLAERDRDDCEAGEGREHLGLSEGDRVVARRIALHQDDLQRVGGRPQEHEQVAERIARADAGEQREPDAPPARRRSRPRRRRASGRARGRAAA